MSTFCYIFFGVFSLAGSWFVFHKLGDKAGKEHAITHYCRDVIYPLKLSDIEELIEIYEGSEKTKPFIIVDPKYWKDFE